MHEDTFWAPEPITISHIPCFPSPSPPSPYILLISHHHYYFKFIILSSYNTYFFPSFFKSCSTTYVFHKQKQYLILIFSPPRLHTLYPLCLSDGEILWARGSFIHSIFASGGDMRDLQLCTLLRYDKLHMKRGIWKKKDERLGAPSRFHCPD